MRVSRWVAMMADGDPATKIEPGSGSAVASARTRRCGGGQMRSLPSTSVVVITGRRPRGRRPRRSGCGGRDRLSRAGDLVEDEDHAGRAADDQEGAVEAGCGGGRGPLDVAAPGDRAGASVPGADRAVPAREAEGRPPGQPAQQRDRSRARSEVQVALGPVGSRIVTGRWSWRSRSTGGTGRDRPRRDLARRRCATVAGGGRRWCQRPAPSTATVSPPTKARSAPWPPSATLDGGPGWPASDSPRG